MAVNLTADEREQLLQTIQMFEAITENQPDDYRSLEILEEAYAKLEQGEKSLSTSRRMAKAYVNGGLVTKAIMTYEAILQKDPKDAEAAKALKELEGRVDKTSGSDAPAAGSAESKPVAARTTARPRVEVPRDDPELLLGKFLVNHGILTARQLESIYLQLRKNDSTIGGTMPATSLIETIQTQGLGDSYAVVELLAEKFQLPYLPLANYSVDADVVKAIPRDLCFRHVATPIDQISRTVLITVTNPYSRPHFESMENKFGLAIQWYINTPQEIKQVLQSVFRLDQVSTKED